MYDRLYFDELTFECVMDMIEMEQTNSIYQWSDSKQPDYAPG